MTALLIGLGNDYRSDDGIGLAVVREVARQLPSGVDVLEVDDPASLLDTWTDAGHVVVVDAMASHRDPGTVITLDVTNCSLPAGGWNSAGTHALGLAAVVELSRALGRLPKRLVVVGIEVEAMTPGARMSVAVGAALQPSVDAVLMALQPGDQ